MNMFLAILFSYLGGFISGVVLLVWLYIKRGFKRKKKFYKLYWEDKD